MANNSSTRPKSTATERRVGQHEGDHHPMSSTSTTPVVSRRTALAGLSASGLGLALAATIHHASAQDAAAEIAKHPLVGSWMGGSNPNDVGLSHFAADGSFSGQGSVIATGPDGALIYSDPAKGVWEPDGARGAHLTFTWASRDATGAVTGYTTVDGYPVASEDGTSFLDDGTKVVITLRDPTGAVTQVINTVPRVIGVRVTPGKPGYEEVLALLATQPAATPGAGTPTT